MAKYKKNYLTDVIFKIDFPPIATLIDKSISVDFEEKIMKDLPLKELIPQFFVTMEKKDGNFNAKEGQQMVWKYKSQDEKKFVEVKSECLVVVLKEYEDFSVFKDFVFKISNFFFEAYDIDLINRLGLRYIDRIILEEENIYDWKEYINGDLIKNLDFISEKKQIKRAVQILEVSPEQDTDLRFKYGIFNSWYPNDLLKKEFFLDCDCYTKIQFPKAEIENKLNKFNKIASEYFEKSITDKFRGKLNDEQKKQNGQKI